MKNRIFSTLLVITIAIVLPLFGACSAGTDNTDEGTTVSDIELTTTASATPVTDTDADKVSLRIEGNNECLYYGEMRITENQSLRDALVEFDKDNDEITITGVEADYITDINGETAAKFGGWDGWLYLVNGESPIVAMSAITLSAGDEIVLYFGDPYGVLGMMFPEYKVNGSVLTFTDFISEGSKALAGLKVLLNETEYTTDELGNITVQAEGEYTLQVKQYAENGLVLALRFPADEKITIVK